MHWNYGDIYDAIAPHITERPALINAEHTFTWADLDRRSNNLARRFLEVPGVKHGAKVAFYLRNCPAYSETAVATFKARLVHVNVNYRYVDDELWYIFDNSDAEIVVYNAEFAEHVAHLRPRLPKVRLFLEIGETSATRSGDAHPVNGFAVDYATLAGDGDGTPLGLERSGDDLMFIYTGGTTGMPKGVMWRQEDRLSVYGGRGDVNSPEDYVARALQRPPARLLPGCPMMHSTGFTTVINCLAQGGAIVTLEERHFDPRTFWEAVQRHRVTQTAIVGDAFARPLLNELEENPGRYDLSSLRSIVSAGVMWSEEVKRGILKHLPDLTLVDTFGSSEGPSLGNAVIRAGDLGREDRTARFRIGEGCKVFTENFEEVTPGSGVAGMIAKSGHLPLGYYKDPARTKTLLPVIDGVRYSIPGDWCTVEADGTITLLGRGSNCINTGGEKVFPEEVEEALKKHPEVHDALVVGLADTRWGQAVTGVVQLERGARLDETGLRDFVRRYIADYKVPKRIVAMPDLGRAANGKADYAKVRAFAEEALGER
jgi:acyl-CoA synthetase (AMP-forming)/AMP-acid ligase II